LPSFCVNKTAQPNGDHEVHNVTTSVFCLPPPPQRQDLGDHWHASSAVQEAGRHWQQVTGCPWCAPECRES